MRVLKIMLVLMLVGCGDQSGKETTVESKDSEQMVEKPIKEQAAATTSTLGTACDSLETSEVASIMGWDGSKTLAEEQMNRKEGRLTVCMFREQDGEVQVLVRISHQSEKAQANKTLEKGYQRALNEGEQNLTYEKIPSVLGTESIIGEGEGNHGYRVYILRNRFDNAIDTTLEMSVNTGTADTRKNQLKALAAAMQ
jgi:hypothetical protein